MIMMMISLLSVLLLSLLYCYYTHHQLSSLLISFWCHLHSHYHHRHHIHIKSVPWQQNPRTMIILRSDTFRKYNRRWSEGVGIWGIAGYWVQNQNITTFLFWGIAATTRNPLIILIEQRSRWFWYIAGHGENIWCFGRKFDFLHCCCILYH